MIPHSQMATDPTHSIPRESGDDPAGAMPLALTREYSPRERG